MLFEIWIFTSRLVERIVEYNLALRRSLLDGRGFVIGYKFVVDKLQDTDFADLAIDSLAVGAGLGLAALLINLFADLSSAEIVYVWSS